MHIHIHYTSFAFLCFISIIARCCVFEFERKVCKPDWRHCNQLTFYCAKEKRWLSNQQTLWHNWKLCKFIFFSWNVHANYSIKNINLCFLHSRWTTLHRSALYVAVVLEIDILLLILLAESSIKHKSALITDLYMLPAFDQHQLFISTSFLPAPAFYQHQLFTITSFLSAPAFYQHQLFTSTSSFLPEHLVTAVFYLLCSWDASGWKSRVRECLLLGR